MTKGESPRRIELVWPGKGRKATLRTDGRWTLTDVDGVTVHVALEPVLHHESGAGPAVTAVRGDRLAALSTLQRTFGRSIDLAYADGPRIDLDDRESTFAGDPDRTWSTWLSVIREHLVAIEPLMVRGGIVALHVADVEAPFAHMLMSDVYWPTNYVGTIVWQRHYAPRSNMTGMKELVATHDLIIVFTTEKAEQRPVVLRRPAEGFANPDHDPRREWKAEHKGHARFERTPTSPPTCRHTAGRSWKAAPPRPLAGVTVDRDHLGVTDRSW